MLIALKRTSAELAACFEDKGKKGVTAGTHIDNLAALGKCIWLCLGCMHKFNAQSYGYSRKKSLPQVRGFCDGCRENGTHTLFAPVAHRDGWTGVKNV